MLDRFEDLIGETLLDVRNEDNKRLVFILFNGDRYKLYHEQDCCEVVTIEDIDGPLDILVGSPILLAEVRSNKNDTPRGIVRPGTPEEQAWQDSYTWTFYTLATARGHLTIRWYGWSNGYYSEEVSWGRYFGDEGIWL